MLKIGLLTVYVIAKERNMEVLRTPSLGRIWTPTEQAISGHSVPLLHVNQCTLESSLGLWCECFVCMCVCASLCAHCPAGRREHWVLGNWHYTWLRTSNWVPATKHGSSIRATSALELLSSPWTHFFSPTDTKRCFVMSWCTFRDKWQALNFLSISNLLCLLVLESWTYMSLWVSLNVCVHVHGSVVATS